MCGRLEEALGRVGRKARKHLRRAGETERVRGLEAKSCCHTKPSVALLSAEAFA